WLVTEPREALQTQTATAEVLGVINTSPGDLAPVFDAMLDKAMRLCEAACGTFFTRDGELVRAVGMRNMPQPFSDYLTAEPVRLRTMLGPSFAEAPLLHVADLAASEGYRRGIPLFPAGVEPGGIRTYLVVPLRKESDFIGVFLIYRQEVRPVS